MRRQDWNDLALAVLGRLTELHHSLLGEVDDRA